MIRLKELRTKYGLSLRKLQECTGIDFSRLAVIEKTDANLETKTVEKLTCFFKVSETYLFGKDGFIFYYDEINNNYFSLPYEQYKSVLTDDVVSSSVVNGCITRTISKEGYERIDSLDKIYRDALNVRLTTERYIDFLDSLNPFEFAKQKERILEYLETKEAKEELNKIK